MRALILAAAFLLLVSTPARAQQAGSEVNQQLEELLARPIKAAPPLQPKMDTTYIPPTEPPRQPVPQKQSGPLQGSASAYWMTNDAEQRLLHGQSLQDDEDAGDQSLVIQWDMWRNRLLRAAEQQVMNQIDKLDLSVGSVFMRLVVPPIGEDPPRFPLGTEATFDCEITNDGRIVNLMITKTSGYRNFDKCVLNGVKALEGTEVLQFPPRSRRTFVRQKAIMATASPETGSKYFNFGDLEKINNILDGK